MSFLFILCFALLFLFRCYAYNNGDGFYGVYHLFVFFVIVLLM